MRTFDDSEEDEDETGAQQVPHRGQQAFSANTDVVDMSGMATSNSKAEEGSSEDIVFLSNKASKQRNTAVIGWGSAPDHL